MFALYFLRRCCKKHIYLLIVLVVLDILSALYSGGVQHPLTRHMFVTHDIVTGFANILYWIVLFVPIGNDIVQEKSSFGVSLFCRMSKQNYMLKKNFALFLYNILFFFISMMISYAVSFINGYKVGSFICILEIYTILVLIGYLFMIFVCFVAWASNSSYMMTTLYAVLITAMQMPFIQSKIAISNLTESYLMSVLSILICAIFLLTATMLIMKHKDCIGMKKGMSI